MRCRDFMKQDLITAQTNEPIYRVAEKMAHHQVGFVPIIDSMRRLVGVVTDRDITTRVVSKKLDYSTPVESVMSRDLVTCRALDSLDDAERQMADNRKSRLPLVDDFGECIGVISLSDIAVVANPEESGNLLNRVAERESRAEPLQ